MVSVCVVWRGSKYVLETESSASLKEFGIALQKLTGVEADTMKLIVPIPTAKRSNLLHPFSDDHSHLSLTEASITEGIPLRMMGVPQKEVENILKDSKVNTRIAGFEEEERRMKQKASAQFSSVKKLPPGPYTFSAFRTLEITGIQLNPPPSEALKRMHMLASDPGIVAIMNKHRWQVGIMTELAPVGKVGVSPKCLLGFNKNHGEEISLRLRTDDLKGFRKYDVIKNTLLHELAHMVHSEHDEHFYSLYNQLTEEANSLDWTKSKAHTLGKVRRSSDIEEQCEIERSDQLNFSQKLGGSINQMMSAPRDSAAAAAMNRLPNYSIVEQDNDDGISDFNEKFTDLISLPKGEHVEDEQELNDSQAGATIEDSDVDVDSKPVESIEEELKNTEDSNQSIGNVFDDEDLIDEELRNIEDPVTKMCERLQKAMHVLRAQVNASEASSILNTLLKIVGNVVDHPGEVKYTKIRKANPIISRNITNNKGAMEILEIVGFRENMVDNGDGNWEMYLVLKRDDPGLLWLAKSSIEAFL